MFAFAGSGKVADTERSPRKVKKLLTTAVKAAVESKALPEA